MKLTFKPQVVLLFIPIITLFYSCNSSEFDHIKLFPVKVGDKWGYVHKSGQFKIQPQFKEAYIFTDGLALFKSNNDKYGYINEDGKYEINPIYKEATSFSEGLACVVLENEFPHYINKKNEVVFSTDKDIEQCSSFEEGLALFISNNKFGYWDTKGNVVIEPIYDYAYLFSEGLALVAKNDSKTDEIKWGYIDKLGKVVIPFQFIGDTAKERYPGIFENNLAFVSNDGSTWGFIDRTGKYQISPQFETPDKNNSISFSNNLSPIQDGNLVGYINTKGKYVINPKFNIAYNFMDKKLAAVQDESGPWGFIDKEGNYKIDPQFEYIYGGFINGVAFVRKNNKYGMISHRGDIISDYQFDSINLIKSLYINTDYLDEDAIINAAFENSNFKKYLGYSASSTLENVLDDYPLNNENKLDDYNLLITNPNLALAKYTKWIQLEIGFASPTSEEVPIYKNVETYNRYIGYTTHQEFVKNETVINKNAKVSVVEIEFTLKPLSAGKAKQIANIFAKEANKKLNVNMLKEYSNDNNDSFGYYILTSNDLLAYIAYDQDISYKKTHSIFYISVLNRNYSETFLNMAKYLSKQNNLKLEKKQ